MQEKENRWGRMGVCGHCVVTPPAVQVISACQHYTYRNRLFFFFRPQRAGDTIPRTTRGPVETSRNGTSRRCPSGQLADFSRQSGPRDRRISGEDSPQKVNETMATTKQNAEVCYTVQGFDVIPTIKPEDMTPDQKQAFNRERQIQRSARSAAGLRCLKSIREDDTTFPALALLLGSILADETKAGRRALPTGKEKTDVGTDGMARAVNQVGLQAVIRSSRVLAELLPRLVEVGNLLAAAASDAATLDSTPSGTMTHVGMVYSALNVGLHTKTDVKTIAESEWSRI